MENVTEPKIEEINEKLENNSKLSKNDKKEILIGILSGCLLILTLVMIILKDKYLPSFREFWQQIILNNENPNLIQLLIFVFPLISCFSWMKLLKPIPSAILGFVTYLSIIRDLSTLWTISMFIMAMLNFYMMIFWALPPLVPQLKNLKMFKRIEDNIEDNNISN